MKLLTTIILSCASIAQAITITFEGVVTNVINPSILGSLAIDPVPRVGDPFSGSILHQPGIMAGNVSLVSLSIGGFGFQEEYFVDTVVGQYFFSGDVPGYFGSDTGLEIAYGNGINSFSFIGITPGDDNDNREGVEGTITKFNVSVPDWGNSGLLLLIGLSCLRVTISDKLNNNERKAIE
jgi:hypothetical protein